MTSLVKIPSIKSERCCYCHVDEDGYVSPIDADRQVFLYPVSGSWKLLVRQKSESKKIGITFCPMCGRYLGGEI